MCAKNVENNKIQRGRRTAPTQQDISSASSEEEEQEQSGSDTGSGSTDFLGQPPPPIPSESSRNSSVETNGNQESSQRRSTNQRENTGRRKQPQPKRREEKTIKEIKRLQSTTQLLIPKLPFQRCVREIVQEVNNEMRLQRSSLECLQEAAEYYLIQLFEDSYLCSSHGSRVTLFIKDMGLALILRGTSDPGRR